MGVLANTECSPLRVGIACNRAIDPPQGICTSRSWHINQTGVPLQENIYFFVSRIGKRIHVCHLSTRLTAKKKLSVRIGWEFGCAKNVPRRLTMVFKNLESHGFADVTCSSW